MPLCKTMLVTMLCLNSYAASLLHNKSAVSVELRMSLKFMGVQFVSVFKLVTYF